MTSTLPRSNGQLVNGQLVSPLDFPLLNKTSYGKRMIYLDNSATTQKPAAVLQAMTNFYEQDNANVHRGVYSLAVRSTVAYERAHEIVAQFIGAQFEEIIFTKGATESLNLLAHSLGKNLQPGDEIVLSEMEHHSNIVPWQHLAKEKGVIIRYIPITAGYRLDLAAAHNIINPKTKIVSLTHMSNVLGTINPLQEIAPWVHQVGAFFIVDAAQSVPHLSVKVQELGCDFLVFSGHKLCGPTGIGVLYGKKELLEMMEPYQYGGDMIKEVTLENSTWNDLPWKFEAGTPPIAEAVGLAAAIEYLQALGMENIMHHEQELTRYTLQQLSFIPGIKLLGPATSEQRGAVFSLDIEGIHPHDVSELLDKDGICVRGGHHCAMPLHKKMNVQGSVRASFYFYNTKEEIDLFLKSLTAMTSPAKALNPLELSDAHLSEEQELYKENILDHYQHPRNKQVLEHYTFTHQEHNPLCGDEIQVYALFNHTMIKEISFMGQGCAISQAAASILVEELQGKPLEQIRKLGPWDMYNLLGIPISHTRSKCALLALKTVQRGAEHVRD